MKPRITSPAISIPGSSNRSRPSARRQTMRPPERRTKFFNARSRLPFKSLDT